MILLLLMLFLWYFNDQMHKKRPLQDFVSDDQSVLVCTDIASRGIDCSKVSSHQ